MKRTLVFYLILITVAAAACTPTQSSTPEPVVIEPVTTEPPTSVPVPAASETTAPVIEPTSMEASMSLQLTSDAFANGQSIPAKFSCIGKNISPALAWNEPPAGTQSFALIVDDPDAPMGTWVHWVLYNIPVDVRELPEAWSATDNQIIVGKNSSNAASYQGPCPPSGTHRYYFKLYALDASLNLQPGAKKDQLLSAMDGHILAQTELMGTFSK